MRAGTAGRGGGGGGGGGRGGGGGGGRGRRGRRRRGARGRAVASGDPHGARGARGGGRAAAVAGGGAAPGTAPPPPTIPGRIGRTSIPRAVQIERTSLSPSTSCCPAAGGCSCSARVEERRRERGAFGSAPQVCAPQTVASDPCGGPARAGAAVVAARGVRQGEAPRRRAGS